MDGDELDEEDRKCSEAASVVRLKGMTGLGAGGIVDESGVHGNQSRRRFGGILGAVQSAVSGSGDGLDARDCRETEYRHVHGRSVGLSSSQS